jgi:hypothetical protein
LGQQVLVTFPKQPFHQVQDANDELCIAVPVCGKREVAHPAHERVSDDLVVVLVRFERADSLVGGSEATSVGFGDLLCLGASDPLPVVDPLAELEAPATSDREDPGRPNIVGILVRSEGCLRPVLYRNATNSCDGAADDGGSNELGIGSALGRISSEPNPPNQVHPRPAATTTASTPTNHLNEPFTLRESA